MSKDKTMECEYCNKLCKNDNSLRNHERLCKLNPNRQILTSSFIEYNRKLKLGLVTKIATNQHTKAKLEGREIVVSEETRSKLSKNRKGILHTKEAKLKIQASMRKAVLNNPDSYTASNVSGRTPIINYGDFKLKGTWELEVAKWLDNHNIKWTNKIDGFDYEWNNSTHIYYPDFFLTEFNRYIEVKGYERERDRAKWKVVKDLIVLKKDEINRIKNNTFLLNL